MQQHPCAVEHADEVAGRVARQARCRVGHDRFAGRFTGQQCSAALVDHRDHVRLHGVRAENGNEPRNTRFVENAVDGRGPAGLRR